MQMELEPYSETKRDLVEARLSAEANKRELTEDKRDGLIVRIYWLKLTNEISLQLVADGETLEAIIPNDLIAEARAHPYNVLGNLGIFASKGNYDDGA